MLSTSPMRRLPANVEAEAALLGAMMIENRLAERIAAIVDADHFHEPLHGRIFSAIMTMVGNGATATPVSLRPIFEDDPAMTTLGIGYLSQIMGSGAGLIGWQTLSKQIRDLASLRDLVEAGRRISEAAADTADAVDPAARLDEAEAILASASDRGSQRSRPIQFASAIAMAVAASRSIAEGSSSLGVQIDGFSEWDDIVGGGMAPGDLIYLAGRPSMGKTSLALRIARGAASSGAGVLFISREMKVLPIATRLLADLLFQAGSSATMDDIKRGRLNDHDYALAAKIEAAAAQRRLVFEEPSSINALRIAPLVRQHKRRMERDGVNLGLVVIDYLGMIEPPTRRGNREQEASDTSRAMKEAAQDTGTAFLVLSQLSRAVEQREDKRPMLSDLRDSGSLEADADAVAFVYRAQYYLERSEPALGDKRRADWEIEMQAERNRLDIIGAKSRQGAVMTKRCFYFDSRQAVRGGDYYQTGGAYSL